jgi:hypothetical protein
VDVIEWSESDIAIRDAVREWIDKEVRPQLDELETGELPPYDLIRTFFADFGISAMATDALDKMLARERRRRDETPEQAAERRERKPASTDPASGLSGAESMAAIAVSELAGVSLGTVASVGVSLGLGAATIAAKGTLEQKERWLPKVVTGERVASWAITEPDSGSDAFGGMKTSVKRDGDEVILKGHKTFITNGPYADVIVVYAKLDEGDGTPVRDRQVLTFVLDKGMPLVGHSWGNDVTTEVARWTSYVKRIVVLGQGPSYAPGVAHVPRPAPCSRSRSWYGSRAWRPTRCYAFRCPSVSLQVSVTRPRSRTRTRPTGTCEAQITGFRGSSSTTGAQTSPKTGATSGSRISPCPLW